MKLLNLDLYREPKACLSHEVVPVDLRAEYERLAAKLNVLVPDIALDEIRRFFSENGVRVYSEHRVKTYLDAHYGAADRSMSPRAAWGWRPLRAADAVAGQWQSWDRNGMVLLGEQAYSKAVPLPVLYTVEKIADKFPDAHFYVSDEIHREKRIEDPFLLCMFRQNGFIVEKWDEPAYRE